MEEENSSTPIESLTTRAFELILKLSKGEELTPQEIVEYIEIQKEMPATSFISELKVINQTLESRLDGMSSSLDARLDTQSSSLDARLDTQNSSLDARLDFMSSSLESQKSEIRVMRWVMMIGIALIAAAGFLG